MERSFYQALFFSLQPRILGAWESFIMGLYTMSIQIMCNRNALGAPLGVSRFRLRTPQRRSEWHAGVECLALAPALWRHESTSLAQITGFVIWMMAVSSHMVSLPPPSSSSLLANKHKVEFRHGSSIFPWVPPTLLFASPKNTESWSQLRSRVAVSPYRPNSPVTQLIPSLTPRLGTLRFDWNATLRTPKDAFRLR